MEVFGVQMSVLDAVSAIVLLWVACIKLINLIVRLTPSKADDKKLAEIKEKWPWIITATDKAFQLVKKMTREGKLTHEERFSRFIDILEGDYKAIFNSVMPESVKQIAKQIAEANHASDKNAEAQIKEITGSNDPK